MKLIPLWFIWGRNYFSIFYIKNVEVSKVRNLHLRLMTESRIESRYLLTFSNCLARNLVTVFIYMVNHKYMRKLKWKDKISRKRNEALSVALRMDNIGNSNTYLAKWFAEIDHNYSAGQLILYHMKTEWLTLPEHSKTFVLQKPNFMWIKISLFSFGSVTTNNSGGCYFHARD